MIAMVNGFTTIAQFCNGRSFNFCYGRNKQRYGFCMLAKIFAMIATIIAITENLYQTIFVAIQELASLKSGNEPKSHSEQQF